MFALLAAILGFATALLSLASNFVALLGGMVAWATNRMQAGVQARTNAGPGASNSSQSQSAMGAVPQRAAVTEVPTGPHSAPAVTALAPVIALPRPVRGRSFTRPSLDFLTAQSASPARERDEEKLQATGETLMTALAAFGVQGKVEAVTTGPTLTTFEVSPALGTKVSKVAGIDDDLSLALGRKVRVLAPIQGTSRLGFEMASEKPAKVALRDIIADERFQQFEGALPVVLGRDSVGRPVFGDLATMPHVIVAGATGSGKSVGLNVMLMSLLYRRTPAELRLLMIDPKVVELVPFDGIPHMLRPVVTDMEQAAQALQWAVSEMDRRFQLFAAAGAKSLASYNARAAEKLPSIVVVIEEYADLVMQQGKAVGDVVTRLAQKARAAGMHIILATQRPSADVITGLIKANFPTRIAYRVSAGVDSRIILDEQGAEGLLGKGDALVKLGGETQRVQCPWVSEDEVNAVTSFLRLQAAPAPVHTHAAAEAPAPRIPGRRPALRVVGA